MSQELAADLAMTMARLLRRLKSADAGAQLSPPCASALAVVVVGGKVRPGDVARIEGVTPASITPVLKELTALGLIVRSVDPADKRAAWLTSTPKGTRWFEEGHARAVRPLTRAIAELQPSARKTLQSALVHLRAIERMIQSAAGQD